MIADLPWESDSDIELGSNELINLFTINRALRRLLENDEAMSTQIAALSAAIAAL